MEYPTGRCSLCGATCRSRLQCLLLAIKDSDCCFPPNHPRNSVSSTMLGGILCVLFLAAVLDSPLSGATHLPSCSLSPSGGDDGPAFLEAVRACSMVSVPKSKTIKIASRLNMTNLKNKHISIQGAVKFSDDLEYWGGNAFSFAFQNQSTFWLLGGQNILLDGGGTLDGSGQAWYDGFAKNSSLVRPIILTVFEGDNVAIQNIKLLNSPEWNNLVHQSRNVVYANIHINSQSTSENNAANTDGWDIYRSDKVVIRDSVINNGDDCVSFKPNATNILVSNLHCNGSHGISVGSLGQYPGIFDIVENVLATDIVMSNAENGARIKAWAGPNVGSGIVKNITFTRFRETNVDNPIIIDQCYETDASVCAEFPSNTLIQDVWFDSISGTSSGKEKAQVASLSCSPDSRCSDINVNDITLSPPSGSATYSCQNVNLTGNAATLFGACANTG
ncbi:pectin lyase fold/virulence factor [Gloeopeniophorella convolvens]|nr:pectin lyase fold/virulence factor [Gloeopeniophorella convolvens]